MAVVVWFQHQELKRLKSMPTHPVILITTERNQKSRKALTIVALSQKMKRQTTKTEVEEGAHLVPFRSRSIFSASLKPAPKLESIAILTQNLISAITHT